MYLGRRDITIKSGLAEGTAVSFNTKNLFKFLGTIALTHKRKF